MKQFISIFTLLLVSICTLSAQKIVRFKDELSGLYGYKQQSKIIIEAQFVNAAKEFSEGLAAVEIKKPHILSDYNWGYIDHTGKFIIAPQFFRANNFSENVASVISRDGWRFINHEGEYIIFDTPVNWSARLSETIRDSEYTIIDLLRIGWVTSMKEWLRFRLLQLLFLVNQVKNGDS